MTPLDRLFGLKGEARVRYQAGEFTIISPGEFVTCMMTGRKIALTELRYWSVERQEAYATPQASLQRHLDLKRGAPADNG